MKLTLAQLNPIVGDIEGNVSRLQKVVKQASSEDSDLAIFPELYLCGYPPRDLLDYDSFINDLDKEVNEIIRFSASLPQIGILFGTPRRAANRGGKGLVNSAVLVCGGKLLAQVDKCLLPTYDVYDEARYFDPAHDLSPIAFKNEVLGISICEDTWNDPEMWDRPIYNFDPVEALGKKGATIFINISASPFDLRKIGIRFRLSQRYAKRFGLPYIMVNQVGGNDELIFDGTSMVLNGGGELIAQLQPFQTEVRTFDLGKPMPPVDFQPMARVESAYRALVLGLSDYVRKCQFTNVLVGLSGGIDSAVTCALAADALGRDRVVSVTMPSIYSSQGSVDDSKLLATNLGITLKEIRIKDIYEAYLQSVGPHFDGRRIDATEENIQARIRGNLLMALSNKFGSLVLSTGNKSELAMGYCTLYGDMSGGLAVLSDVPKTLVYKLAHYINREKEVIPEATIKKAPSAELRPDQKDEDSLPPYEILDKILEMYVELKKSAPEIVAAGFDRETVAQIIKTVDRNEYKRRQAAPGLKVTSKAFGSGRRMPVAAKYDSHSRPSD
jgi:NAD+ synthase (glutamine-hydrolysing)